jgi:hypothetical protein
MVFFQIKIPIISIENAGFIAGKKLALSILL